jgi:eukaryotic-like serine/threonine-protein kinase
MADRFPPLRPEDPKRVATYMLCARLGAGGMGDVYLSFSPGGYPLAIKVIKQAFADDPDFRRRFRREVAAAQRVQGYYTAPMRDAAPDDEIPWYATAYIAGPSLHAAVAEYGPLPADSVFRLLAGAAEGVAAVHAAGLIHRDLKPGNVLLAGDGPRVIDFGLAQADASSRLTGTGIAVGTPAYMAPEQIRGHVSEATDVFALGHLALFAATGHNAFVAGHADALFYRLLNEPPNLDGCPSELRPVIANCLAKNPADRPTVREVAAFAGAAMRARMMHPAGWDWLPRPLADSLEDYAASNAPHPSLPGVSNAQYSSLAGADAVTPALAPRPVRRAAGAASARRRFGPGVVASAALFVAAGAVLGFVAGHAGNASARAATPLTSVSPAAQASSPATAGSGGPSASGSGAGGFTQAYANAMFTMPGGSCRNVASPSDVVLPGSQPFVDTQDDGSDGDMDIKCTPAPELTFRDTVAPVSGTPGAEGCIHAVTTAPMVGSASYQQLRPGSQFCLLTTSSTTRRMWIMLVTLKSLNKSADDLVWTATVWFREPSVS